MAVKRFAPLLVSILFFSFRASAEGHLRITLIPSDSSDPTKVTLTFVNDGDAPISFDKYSTPLALLGGTSTAFDQFDVIDVNSPKREKANYLGYFAHPSAPKASNFLTLDAGQSLVARYDLWPNYLMTPGKTYAITFNMIVGYGPQDESGNSLPTNLHIMSTQEVHSNPIDITVPDSYHDRMKAATKGIHILSTP